MLVWKTNRENKLTDRDDTNYSPCPPHPTPRPRVSPVVQHLFVILLVVDNIRFICGMDIWVYIGSPVKLTKSLTIWQTGHICLCACVSCLNWVHATLYLFYTSVRLTGVYVPSVRFAIYVRVLLKELRLSVLSYYLVFSSKGN